MNDYEDININYNIGSPNEEWIKKYGVKKNEQITIEEALKILKEPDRIGYNIIKSNDIETTQYNINSQMALHMAIKALEKEIPTKPIIKSNAYGWEFYKCPLCNVSLGEFKQKRCKDCGQILKWEIE